MLSGTEATHHHQSLDDIVDAKSVTSYAATVTDIHGKGVNLPPPPKGVNGERDFECPYCYIICPARYGRGRPWRTHLLQDLQPYVCTYPDCEASEQLFRSRREWNEHEASHRKAWRCPEHPSAVYRTRLGLEDHLRQQHLDSFPENQMDVMVNIGETSTVETRERCPICFLPADAEGMDNFANHVANHLERFATFALSNNTEDDQDGASSIASRGRSGSTASQDVSGMSLPSDISDQQEQGEESVVEVPDSDETSHSPHQGPQDVPSSQHLLSAESLLSIPDMSKDRLGTLLTDHRADVHDGDGNEDGEAENIVAAGLENHLGHLEQFRTYMSSLSGAQSVRFFKRYGAWRGHAIFSTDAQTANAMEVFDQTLFPEVKLQQGTGHNRNKLKFSVEIAQSVPETPTRQSTLETRTGDDESVSSASVEYDDVEANSSKQAMLDLTDIPTLHDMYRSRKLLQRDQSFAPSDAHNRIISFCYHDLTRMRVDAIVNSANQSLKISKHSPTLNYHVHKAGGPDFTKEATSKGKLKPGQAALTRGHNLPCDYVIHAARPHYGTNKGMGQFNILTECYRSALKIALLYEFKTIAFPCLGAGGCGFPPRIAARIALQEAREFLDSHTEHRFERVVFVVKSVADEKAYMDLFPAFFPPTHGDLEAARSSASSAGRASLAAEVLEARLLVQKVARDLSGELSLYVPDFPREIQDQLNGIDEAIGSIRGFLLGSKTLKQSLSDLDLLCFVMQSICNDIAELTETAKTMPYSGGRDHSDSWNAFNNQMKLTHRSDLEGFLSSCREFAQYLDNVLTRNGTESKEIAPIRVRLNRFKAKQQDRGGKDAHQNVHEAPNVSELQRETSKPNRDVVGLDQIPSVAQLYALQKLEEKSTMVQPSATFNQKVCMIREDITKLDVTVMVNSTDVTFGGMGTLDRKIFNKGGFKLRDACNKFEVCSEGDVKTTGGYDLPSKYVLHAVPPEQWRKNSKDVLRQIYREILHTAQSLQATSIAIPAIGTGMLNFPRRDCAALAMEEVNRFLETAEPTNSLEKIIFVVYSSNDEFVYKSLLPVYFPPADRRIDKQLPASHPFPRNAPLPPETVSPPRKTIFSSIGDAVRNLGSSRSGKRPATHTWRPINSYEEHALIGFESHAQGCDTCKDLERLYQNRKDLCEHGYPLAQTLLWYMNMGSDQLIYTRPVQIRRSIRLEVPDSMFPLSLTLLRIVEASTREEDREQPWVSQHRAYRTVVRGQDGQDDAASGPTIYNAETAHASVEIWSASEQAWSPVSPSECIIFIRPGKLDVYEAHAPSTAQEPLLTFVLEPDASVTKVDHQAGLVLHGAVSVQFDNHKEIKLLSQGKANSVSLLAMLKRANPDILLTTGKGRLSTHGSETIALPSQIPAGGSEPKGGSQKLREGRLSPLQENMQKLNEAASNFNRQSPEQRLATITQLGDHVSTPNPPHPLRPSQTHTKSSEETLTAVEHQILYHLTNDLKSRPGSYIGQTAKDIALSLKRPLTEVLPATESLASKYHIHNTINESTWVISHPPEELPTLANQIPETSTQNMRLPDPVTFDKTEQSDVLFQMNLLEQQILSFFTTFNAESTLAKGCKPQDIADALGKDVEDIELALDQLAEQGKMHLAPNGVTWNTPLPRQHNPPGSSRQAQVQETSEAPQIRDATDFQDTSPSPVLAATTKETQNRPINIADTMSLDTLDTDAASFYPYDPATRWTRIDASYVDQQVLADLGEEFHRDGYSIVVHRVLRRGELKEWVQKTLDLRLKKTETTKVGGGVSGHAWMGRGRGRGEASNERDQHQANLDRLLAGDLREDELRHFKADEEVEWKR